MRFFHIKSFFLHCSVFITSILTVITTITIFLIGNQNTVMPILADYISRQTIPFNLVVSKKNMPHLRKVHSMSLNKNQYTYRDKQDVLKFISEFKKKALKTTASELLSEDRDKFFSGKFSEDMAYRSFISGITKQEHSKLYDIIPTAMGADKHGKFAVLDYVVASDASTLDNNQVKMYYTISNSEKKVRISGFKRYGKPVINAGGLAGIYSALNNANLINTGYNSVQQFFSKLDFSSVYNDSKNLDGSVKFLNLTNGMNRGSKLRLKKIIQDSEGNFNNYGLQGYEITDVPNQVKMDIAIGGINKVYHYVFVYDNAKQEIVEIK